MAKRSWTKESAMSVVSGNKRGLRWCSAFDYLKNHCGINPVVLMKG